MKPSPPKKTLLQLSRRHFCTLLGASLGTGLLAGCATNIDTSFLTQQKEEAEKQQQAQQNRPLQKEGSIKVVLILPLSAKQNGASGLAKSLKQAGELALFDFNNPNILLVTKDDKGTPEGAKLATEQAVQEGAELIIGPLFANSVKAAAPVARQANIPMIALSSDQSVAGNGVYLLSFLAGRDVPRIISYGMSQGKRNYVALIPNTPYGLIVENIFRTTVAAQGGQIVALERYPLDANGMTEPVKKIAEVIKNPATPVDAVLMPGGVEAIPSLAPLLPYFEVDIKTVKIMGTGLWDYPNISKEQHLVGGWFPAPDPKGWQDFTGRYSKTYNSMPPRIASLAYDAVSLAVSLSSNEKGSRYTPETLTRASGFSGIDGLFRLLPDGTSERGLAIMEVQKTGPQVVQPAPTAFGQNAQF